MVPDIWRWWDVPCTSFDVSGGTIRVLGVAGATAGRTAVASPMLLR